MYMFMYSKTPETIPSTKQKHNTIIHTHHNRTQYLTQQYNPSKSNDYHRGALKLWQPRVKLIHLVEVCLHRRCSLSFLIEMVIQCNTCTLRIAKDASRNAIRLRHGGRLESAAIMKKQALLLDRVNK